MDKTLLFLSIFTIVVASGCPTEGNPYTRIKDSKFQVAHKTFVLEKGNGPKVTLLGTVHIGEERYYQEQQHILDKADIVLYEDIALTDEERSEILKNCPENYDAGGGHTAVADLLGLTTQTTHIKKRSHFVHADIMGHELLDLLKGESSSSICARLGKPSTQAEGPTAEQLKNVQPDSMRSFTALILVKSLEFKPEHANANTGIYLFHRNNTVVKVFNKTANESSSENNIVIYYGAGHMPDLENSLRLKGYVHQETQWLSAFSL